MIKFTVTSAGQTAINGATASSPVIIDGIALYQGDKQSIKTISEFGGSVYKDECGIGEYVKISFEDTSSTAYTLTSLDLMSGSTIIATSDPVSVVKGSNKYLKLEISCQFTGASKCSFNTITIALPHATQFREGVIRLARTSGESEKDVTVYSATDTDQKISDISQTLGEEFIPWTKTGSTVNTGEVQLDTIIIVDDYSSPTSANTVTIEATSSGLSIDKTLTGNVVSSTPTISYGSITGSNKVVNESYISSLYSNAVDTATTETTDATKLVTSHAVRSYVESKISTLDAGLVHIAGAETITGGKTFTGGIVANSSITGTGVYSSYDATSWANTANNGKLPTLETVRSAIVAGDNAVTTAFQNADTNLQSQIDAINAGQNLADIVDLCADLTGHSLTGLKARGDTGITIGDKIEVLHDKTKADGTQDPTASGVSTVYELVKGTPSVSDVKDKVSTVDNQYYWHYIGEYGVDAYTKSESDSTFVSKSGLDQTLASTSSTTNAPSTKATYDAIDGLRTEVGNNYVKLTSSSTQTIDSDIIIDTGSHTVTFDDGTLTSDSNYSIIAGSTSGTAYSKVDLNATNSQFTVYLGSSNKALSLEKSSSKIDVYGDYVASYRNVTSGTLSDGRLVTVDYLNAYTGDLSGYAKLNASNTFTGTTNTFNEVSATSFTGNGVYSSYNSTSWGTATTQIPTVSAVKSAMADAKSDTLDDISTLDAIGSIGLFIYSETGAEKGYGDTVSGQYLKPLALSLPLSGQISYKAVATNSALTGTWKLMSAAFKRTANEHCLVLAQKISNS